MDVLCERPGAGLRIPPSEVPDPTLDITSCPSASRQIAVLAGGCFWCVEAVFQHLDGVLAVRSGYTGGSAESADYRSVCSGTSGHAEAVEVEFDPERLSFGQLLKVFFTVAHDPTQLNRQGNDRGRQYRSAIFCVDEPQRRVAEAYIRQLDAARVFDAPIATRLEPLVHFYGAEDYHQDYAARNPNQPYIDLVARPKVDKLRAYFPGRVKRPEPG
ncbi:MAG: peptide-methionine (S)-S-oxide reductase MsrA [Gammaproteobacteria bacterium]